jgi:hypothetical protein
MVDDQILDRYQRAGVPLADLRRARMTVGGPPVWMVHPLPPRQEPFASWVRLRAAHAQTGLWPFLVGPDLKEVHWQAISELWYDAAAEHGLTADTRSPWTWRPFSPNRRPSSRSRIRRRSPWIQPRLRGLTASRSWRSPPAINGAVGGVEPEPLGDLGRCAALGTGDGVRHDAFLSRRRRESLKATSLLARMGAAGAGKQCRSALNLHVMRHCRGAYGQWSVGARPAVLGHAARESNPEPSP